ncbi:MAG TPA: methyltransferase [Candidatus Binataceae bacterium]|nr:methyltransferase [Candidatus Binataceae bacterium]
MEFAELAAIAGAHAEARAIQVALKLGVFEAIAEHPASAADLARIVGAEPRATALLANAIAAMGLLEFAGGRYALSAAARRFLVKASPEYLGGLILFDEAIFPLWSSLEDAVRSGRPARTPDMFQSDAAETERFIRAMDSLVRARGDARWVAEHLDLRGARTIADLGGGPGTYLAALLRQYPAASGEIWDLKATLEVTRRILAEREAITAARITLRPLDYLIDDLPGPVDAIFISNIVHGETAAANEELMRKCFRSLARGGTIVIKDHVMNRELTHPRAGAVFSLYLLLATRGRDYSFEEIAGWLEDAGFSAARREDLPSPPFSSALVIAAKP